MTGVRAEEVRLQHRCFHDCGNQLFEDAAAETHQIAMCDLGLVQHEYLCVVTVQGMLQMRMEGNWQKW